MGDWIQQNLGSLLAALSVLAAIGTWAAAFVRDRAARKMSHTADVIAILSTNERLAEANFQISRMINENKRVLLKDVEELDAGTERYLIDILNYYEYLCELYRRGVLDKNTIVHLRGGLMVKTYEICEYYIHKRRQDQGRPELYQRFEQLVKELVRPG